MAPERDIRVKKKYFLTPYSYFSGFLVWKTIWSLFFLHLPISPSAILGINWPRPHVSQSHGLPSISKNASTSNLILQLHPHYTFIILHVYWWALFYRNTTSFWFLLSIFYFQVSFSLLFHWQKKSTKTVSSESHKKSSKINRWKFCLQNGGCLIIIHPLWVGSHCVMLV